LILHVKLGSAELTNSESPAAILRAFDILCLSVCMYERQTDRSTG
jgi:hypothetical protein